MKETKQDVIDIAKSLKALDADSIPVNFCMRLTARR